MVLVTDRQYSLDPKLKEKLDLMIKRMDSGKDNLLLIDGDEGDGKTNMSLLLGYYVAHTCDRDFSLKNIFFDLDELIEFAIKTKEQVIIWDEGALGGLASEWWNKNQKKFIKLLMVARKRKHFWVVNIPKFFKMNEYFVIDRSIGLVHVYLRGGTEHGRFVYFNQIQKEKLWEDWKRSRVRGYKKWWSFHGSFVMFLGRKRFSDIIDEVQYDKKKDIAIMSIAKEDEPRKKETDYRYESDERILEVCEQMGLNRKETAEKMCVGIKVLERIVTKRNKLRVEETLTPKPLRK